MTPKQASKLLTEIFGEFYSPMRLLSYGRYMLFSVGIRSIGKSTGWAIYFLIMYLAYGKKWIYVRRTDTELRKSCRDFFNDAADLIKEYGYECDVRYEGRRYYVNGELAGVAIPLAEQQHYRGFVLPDTWYILYDEFMIDPTGGSYYLGGRENTSAEVKALLNLRITADRGKHKAIRNEVICILTGNAGTFFNPFFIHYGIDKYLRPDTRYLAPKGKLWVLEQTFKTAATDQIENSISFRLSEGAMADYAFKNQYADISEIKFVTKLAGEKAPMCNIIYDGVTYGIWVYPQDSIIYVSTEPVQGDYVNLALTTRDHGPNYYMIRNYSDSRETMQIKRMYDMGLIRFRNAKCKFALDFFLRYAII